MYLPPLPEYNNKDLLDECFKIMNSQNKNPYISRIENVEEEQSNFYKLLGFRLYSKDKEYVYAREDLVRLSGKKFKNKRFSYNYFTKHYNYKIEDLREDSINECLKLLIYWKNERQNKFSGDSIYNKILLDNVLVQKEALLNFSNLDLIGKIVRVDGELKAYSFGFELNKDTFCILSEVADLNFYGIAQFLFREFSDSLEKYKYINVMDDSGLENLRRTKLSYQPKIKVPIF
jgi:hypothetical protein